MLHPKDNRPIVSFKTAKHFENWLKTNHKIADGMWLRFYKKGSGVASITYSEAVEVALCYGWIDAVMNKYDEQSYIQRFTPRRPKSIWSKINIDKVTRLIEAGRMKPAGFILPSSISRVTLSMLILDHILFGRLGVNR